MTRENAKDFIPLVQALAEGKTIQMVSNGKWFDITAGDEEIFFNRDIENYRIKPETEYVPFKSIKELVSCWNRKNNTYTDTPLIWVKHKIDNEVSLITAFDLQEPYDLVFLTRYLV